MTITHVIGITASNPTYNKLITYEFMIELVFNAEQVSSLVCNLLS